MVVPKRSATPTTFEKSATPSKLPRPTSRKAQPPPPLSSPARDFKPPTSAATAAARTPTIADVSSAIFDLNGRRVRKNSLQDAVTPASVDPIPDTSSSSVTPNDEDRCVDGKDHSAREDHLKPDGEVFTLPKLRLNRATTFLGKINTSTEASGKDLIGDGNLAVSDYIQQPRENTPSSSTTSEPDAQLRRVISQCSFVNICPGGECRKEDSPPAGGGQCCPTYWVTFLTCLVMLLSTVSLAITLLVSYEHLMALYYAWFHDDLTLSLEVSEGRLESFTDLMLKFWVALKKMIGLEG